MSNDYNYNNYNSTVPEMFPSLWQNDDELKQATSSTLTFVFLRMFAALLVTAAAAMIVAGTPSLMFAILGNQVVFFVLLILELGLVIGISAGINKLSATASNVLFFTFAIVNGLTLSVIFLAYSLSAITQAFAVSALMFAAMAIYGAITKKDLATIGSICLMALVGLIIASVVNMFFRSDTLDMIVCYVGVLVFVGLTAYDTQRIKHMLEEATVMTHGDQETAIKKITVIGALTLYLDFINLFLKILRLVGRRS